MKVYVRVRKLLDAPILKRTVEKDGKTVIVYKRKGKKEPGWPLEITSIQPKKGLFGTKLYVDAYPYARKTISFNHSNETIDEPRWNKEESHRYINAEILKKVGQEPKEKSNTALWIIAGLIIASIVLPFVLGGR